MKITQRQLTKLFEMALLPRKEEESNFATVEAEVWGTNSARSDKRWVTFKVAKPTSFSEIEIEAIDHFYIEGGQGDDPYVNQLIVDGHNTEDQHLDEADVNNLDEVNDLPTDTLQLNLWKMNIDFQKQIQAVLDKELNNVNRDHELIASLQNVISDLRDVSKLLAKK